MKPKTIFYHAGELPNPAAALLAGEWIKAERDRINAAMNTVNVKIRDYSIAPVTIKTDSGGVSIEFERLPAPIQDINVFIDRDVYLTEEAFSEFTGIIFGFRYQPKTEKLYKLAEMRMMNFFKNNLSNGGAVLFTPEIEEKRIFLRAAPFFESI